MKNKDLTDFGKFLRKLRIDENEKQADMAKRLGVSQGKLVNIEYGTKSPQEILEKLQNNYNLTEAQKLELEVCSLPNTISFELSNLTMNKKLMLMSLAKKIDSLDEKTTKAVINLLQK